MTGKRQAWIIGMALVATACGTTTGLGAQRGSGLSSSSGTGLAANGLGSNPSPRAQSVGAGPAGTGAAVGTGGIGGGTAGTGTAGPAGAVSHSTPTGALGGGVSPISPAGATTGGSATPIVIGYDTPGDYSSVVSAVGVSNASIGDPMAQMQALASYVNSHGGLLGHKIVLANYDENLLQASSNPDQAAQEACTQWTEDDHVFAALDTSTIGATDDTLENCLAAHHTPLIAAEGDGDGSTQNYSLPYGPFSPDAMTFDRYMPALVGRLVANHFFVGWNTATGQPGPVQVKIGLTNFDDPEYNAYAAGLKKGLAAYGMHVTDQETYGAGAQNASAGASAAVLRFRADGITTVFNANIAFYEDAESQGYYPRYAVDDYIDPALLAAQAGIAKELHGSMGSGFLPTTEVATAPPPTAATTLCEKVMDSAGQTGWQSSNSTLQVMESNCDDVFLLVSAIDKAGVLSAAAVANGINALGESFVPAMTYQTNFGPTRHDGASEMRDYSYNDSCTCYEFTTNEMHPA